MKVKVNLLVAVPATLLMLFFGVEAAVLWGVLTFFARFIPYLGGIVAYALPVASAALQFESPMRAIFFAVHAAGAARRRRVRRRAGHDRARPSG